MSDRHLCKAKRTDNGEWVIWNVFSGIPCNISISGDTLCQCTGLKDKNGQLIWENDIVELYDKINDYTWRAKVEFGNPNGLYSWGWQLAPIEKCEENPDILLWVEMEDIGVLCEVIGSAIDNPELLEGGAE